MSKPGPEPAAVFAALGDRTRLALMRSLAGGEDHSISDLARGATISRQAVTKHLRVLEEAGLVTSRRVGRESRFAIDPDSFATVDAYLRAVRAEWQTALARLRDHVDGE